MQNTEDNSQGKPRPKQQSTPRKHAKTLKEIQKQTGDKGERARRQVTQVGHGNSHRQNQLPAKTLPQQSRSAAEEGAAAHHPKNHDLSEVKGPPSIPAEAKVKTATQRMPAGGMPNPTPDNPPDDSSKPGGADLGFGKTMMMSSPVAVPGADSPPAKAAPARAIPAKGAEAKTAKTLMMSSPIQAPQADNPPPEQAEETRSPNVIKQIAKTLMMSSPIQAPQADDPPPKQEEGDTPKAENTAEAQIAKTLMMSSPIEIPKTANPPEQSTEAAPATKETPVTKDETKSPASARGSEAEAGEASAGDIKQPEAAAPIPLKKGPLFDTGIKTPAKAPVTDSETSKDVSPLSHSESPANTSPEIPSDIDPSSQPPKNIWALTAVVLGFMLALSLAANGYLWFALSKAEQEQAGTPEKSGDNSVQTAAAVTAVAGSESGTLKQVQRVKNKKNLPVAPKQQAATTKTKPKESPQAGKVKPAAASPKPAAPTTKPTAIKKGFGRLVVKTPGEKGRTIRVSVNTIYRGLAPLELELEPGKYDLNFSRKGQRSFKRVMVEEGATVEVTAKVPKK